MTLTHVLKRTISETDDHETDKVWSGSFRRLCLAGGKSVADFVDKHRWVLQAGGPSSLEKTSGTPDNERREHVSLVWDWIYSLGSQEEERGSEKKQNAAVETTAAGCFSVAFWGLSQVIWSGTCKHNMHQHQ
jgi:hypothetical protein